VSLLSPGSGENADAEAQGLLPYVPGEEQEVLRSSKDPKKRKALLEKYGAEKADWRAQKKEENTKRFQGMRCVEYGAMARRSWLRGWLEVPSIPL
jgi:hypothetical protein